jgi:hypothetical protein
MPSALPCELEAYCSSLIWRLLGRGLDALGHRPGGSVTVCLNIYILEVHLDGDDDLSEVRFLEQMGISMVRLFKRENAINDR